MIGSREHCQVMGIVNVTPDSFSDGGACFDHATAIAYGLRLVADGADIVDVGGESTRPRATRVDADEELRRVLPVVRELAASGVVVSVDTMRAGIAEAAVNAGAVIVNDVSGGLADPAMARVVTDTGVTYVAMHWRGHSDRMHRHAHYSNVVNNVVGELRDRLEALADAGVAPSQVVLDPGLGFAKEAEHNWALLTNLGALLALERPVLVGASRKSFLGAALTTAAGLPPPRARDAATLAVSTLAAAEGASCVRMHDVRGTRDAMRIAAAWRGARRTTYGRGDSSPAEPADDPVRLAP